MSRSYIPKEDNSLPPIYMTNCTEFQFNDAYNDAQLFQQLHSETIKFAVQRNFYVLVKIVKRKKNTLRFSYSDFYFLQSHAVSIRRL